ncbi:MAG: hypothetical protein CVU87_04000 [Firmicutes bacterium HGW-Firmicutes-12]|jgi:hypothetical protein|nr:MAG: hypothetical protein CVU87_04000 [Firmicutes bacterium HGW-Firmicutes-12]
MIFIRRSVIASFIIGILVGAATLNIVCGKHLEHAKLEIEKLEAKLADQTEQITALEKTLAQRQVLVVTGIEVHVSFKDEALNEEYNTLEIEKSVNKLLKDIRGKKIPSLDPLLITSIIEGRSIKISNEEYILSVKSLLISEKLIIYVEITAKEDM